MKLLISSSLNHPSLKSESGSWGHGIFDSDRALDAVAPIMAKTAKTLYKFAGKEFGTLEELQLSIHERCSKYKGGLVTSLKAENSTLDLTKPAVRRTLKELLPYIVQKIDKHWVGLTKELDKTPVIRARIQKYDDGLSEKELNMEVWERQEYEITSHMDNIVPLIAFANMFGLSVPNQTKILMKIWPFFKGDAHYYDSPSGRKNAFRKAFPYVKT